MIARIPPLLVWLTAAVGAATVGLAAMPVVSRLNADPGPLPQASFRQAIEAPPRPDLSAIIDFAPFGQNVPTEPEAAVVETALGLTLHGVTIAASASGSQAIIAGGDLPVGSYAVGAAINGAATLAEVYPDHVVLRVGDRLETLSFANADTDAAGDVAEQEEEDEPVAAVSNGYLRNLRPAAGTQDQPVEADRAATVAEVRADLQRNPAAVLAKYGIEPTGDGYLITDATPQAVLDIGLAPGDVIISANGRALEGIDVDQVWFDQVAASGQVRLELIRDGQTIALSSPLQ